MHELLLDAYRNKRRLHVKVSDGFQFSGTVLNPPGSKSPGVFEIGEAANPYFVAVQHVVHVSYSSY